MKHSLTETFIMILVLFGCRDKPEVLQQDQSRVYYISVSGNDENSGTKERPWKTIGRLNLAQLGPGDTVYFAGGETFSGTIVVDSGDRGSPGRPVVITSAGDAVAAIHSGDVSAIVVNATSNITVANLSLRGNGRNGGNHEDGLKVINSTEIRIDSLDIGEYQKSGLLIHSSSDVRATRVSAHDNGFAGIHVNGGDSKDGCKNIYIGYCRADNNPGDPTNFTNHSGNGILAGFSRNVLIEHSSATNNGWDMPRQGNGPVGIWTYESDSVIIQHCVSYRNKTSRGSADGGGFDLDGGVTNSIIQYCRSYENEGSGYGIFQYEGASPWHNNIVRHCVSENDGTGTHAKAGVFIWNSSRDSAQFSNLRFYNNKIINRNGACILYDAYSEHADFRFYDNELDCKTETARK